MILKAFFNYIFPKQSKNQLSFLVARDVLAGGVLLYFILFVLEHLKNGFVSDFFKLNYFLLGLIIYALFLLVIKKLIK